MPIAPSATELEAKDVGVRFVQRLEDRGLQAVTISYLRKLADMCRQGIPDFRSISTPHQPYLQGIEPLRAGDRDLPDVGPGSFRAEQVRRLFRK